MQKKYIYKITNLINGKIYIGQTNNYKRRFNEHKSMIAPKNYNSSLYKAFIKYGINNFSFEVLEYTADYNEREIYYIQLYNAHEDGYNLTTGGENPPIKIGEDNPFCAHTLKDIENIIYDLKYTSKSFQVIKNEYNYSNIGTISRINCGVIWKKQGEKYPLRKNYLTDEEINIIIDKLLNSDESQYKIARDLGIARSTVTMINIGKNYARQNMNYPLRKKK